MSRTDTIEVLNKADEITRKMRWIEFTQEMSFLWAGEEGEWKPGDRLTNSWGVTTRPFFSELDDAETEALEVAFSCLMWCRDCQVGWEDTEVRNCWSCDRVSKVPEGELCRCGCGQFTRMLEPYAPRDVLLTNQMYIDRAAAFGADGASQSPSPSFAELLEEISGYGRLTLNQARELMGLPRLTPNARQFLVGTRRMGRSAQEVVEARRARMRGVRGPSAMGFIVDEWAPGDLREDALNIAYTSFEAIERRMIDGIEYAAGVQAAVDEEELLTPRERALAWRRANGEALAGLNQPINQRRRRRNA